MMNTILGMLAISAGVGLVIALIVTGIMVWRLHSVRSQAAADSYIKSGSMKVTKRSDLFLYSHVDRRERPKENKSGGNK